jgi:hypothetical protein
LIIIIIIIESEEISQDPKRCQYARLVILYVFHNPDDGAREYRNLYTRYNILLWYNTHCCGMNKSVVFTAKKKVDTAE